MEEWKLAEKLTVRELATFADDAGRHITNDHAVTIDATAVTQVDILGLQAILSLSAHLNQSDTDLQVSISKGGAIEKALFQFGFCREGSGQLSAPYTYEDVLA